MQSTDEESEFGSLPFRDGAQSLSNRLEPVTATVGLSCSVIALWIVPSPWFKVAAVLVAAIFAIVLSRWFWVVFARPSFRRIRTYPSIHRSYVELEVSLNRANRALHRLFLSDDSVGIQVESAFVRDGRFLICVDSPLADLLPMGIEVPTTGRGNGQLLGTGRYVGKDNVLGLSEFEFDGSPMITGQIIQHHKSHSKYVPDMALVFPRALLPVETLEESNDDQ